MTDRWTNQKQYTLIYQYGGIKTFEISIDEVIDNAFLLLMLIVGIIINVCIFTEDPAIEMKMSFFYCLWQIIKLATGSFGMKINFIWFGFYYRGV